MKERKLRRRFRAGQGRVDAVACGSMFVCQGALKAVLISYLSANNIEKLQNISL